MKKVILTGIRPTGKLHIGHYFGAIKQWVALQDDYETYLEIADVQGLTDNFENPEKIRDNVKEVAIDILASGIDPKKAHICVQSMIPEIAELTVFYSNLVTIARLYRNPTVKGEIEQKKELFGEDGSSLTYGFLGYPVSQAADITAFNADLVPVGEDQEPMLEQAREIVRKFNHIYGNTLVEPQILVDKSCGRIKGLDGNGKMGKSLGNAIYLSDSEDVIREKVRQAVTDPAKIHKDDPANPEKCMVYYYHLLFSPKNECPVVKEECEKGHRGCVGCKKQLADNILAYLRPIQERRAYYEAHPEEVARILLEGTEAARKKAQETMKKVRHQMKIDYDFTNPDEK